MSISTSTPAASTATTTLATDVERRIREELRRNAETDAGQISVTMLGDCAILRGSVRSWLEHKDAERAAFNTPGVGSVDNQLALIVKAALHHD